MSRRLVSARFCATALAIVLPVSMASATQATSASRPELVTDPAQTVAVAELESPHRRAHTALASVPGGGVVAVWGTTEAGNDRLASIQRDEEGQWSEPSVLPCAPVGVPCDDLMYPSVDVDAAGIVTAVWYAWDQKARLSSFVTSIRSPAGAWSSPAVITTAPRQPPSQLAVAENGAAMFIWGWGSDGNRRIRAVHRPVDGTWTEPTVLGTGVAPVLTVGPEGEAVVLYTKRYEPAAVVKARVHLPGEGWKDAQRIGRGTWVDAGAVGSQGQAVAVWSRTDSEYLDGDPAYYLMAAAMTSRGRWGSPERITPMWGSTFGADALIDPSGRAVVSTARADRHQEVWAAGVLLTRRPGEEWTSSRVTALRPEVGVSGTQIMRNARGGLAVRFSHRLLVKPAGSPWSTPEPVAVGRDFAQLSDGSVVTLWSENGPARTSPIRTKHIHLE